MSTTATITNVCQIAENFGHQIGLAEFEIERIVHARNDGKNEWLVHVQFGEIDPLIENDHLGATIIVDETTEVARLVESL